MNFFDFSTFQPGGGSKWLILLDFFDFSTFRLMEEGVDLIEFFRLFNLSILGGGSKWSILLNTSRPRGEGLISRFNCFFLLFDLEERV